MGLPKILKKILPQQWVYNYDLKEQQKRMYNEMSREEWEAKGKPLPPPTWIKRESMVAYAQKYKATRFVETGTFMGDTTNEMKNHFKNVDTCELDERLAQRAIQRFKNDKNIKVWQGDSGKKIKEIIAQIPKNETCLFWLDGHFSGGVTAKADLNTPIWKELDEVFKHGNHHVIFIDDARLFFNGEEDYPSFDELEKQIKLYNPQAVIKIEDDIIKVTPN